MNINTADTPPESIVPENVNQANFFKADIFQEELFPLRQYELKKKLGEGSYGVVYLAEHRETKRTVALKIMKKAIGVGDTVENEIKALEILNHRHIVKMHQKIITPNYACAVLAEVKGGDLHSYAFKEPFKPLPRTLAKRYFAQLISGIHYMHKKNVVHRDLKLNNLLVTERDDIIITDFGFAGFVLERNGVFNSPKYTPYYGPPEIGIQKTPYTQYDGVKADIWACGIILYNLLYGSQPFTNRTEGMLEGDEHRKGKDESYYYASLQNTKLLIHDGEDEEVKKLLHGMFAYDPKDRFTTDNIVNSPWLKDYIDLFDVDLMESKEKEIETWTIPDAVNDNDCLDIQYLTRFDTINPPDIPYMEMEYGNENESDPLFLSEDQLTLLKTELRNRIQQEIPVTTVPGLPTISATSSKQISEKQPVIENQIKLHTPVVESTEASVHTSTKDYQSAAEGILKKLGNASRNPFRKLTTTANILDSHDKIDVLNQFPLFDCAKQPNAMISTSPEYLMASVIRELTYMGITFKMSDIRTIECTRPKLARPWKKILNQPFKQRQLTGKEGYDFGGEVKFSIELLKYADKSNITFFVFTCIKGDTDTSKYIRHKILKSLNLDL